MKIKYLLFMLIGMILLPSCSGDNNDAPYDNTIYNFEMTDALCDVWKITEWEEAGKSYYTKDFETSWIICSKEGTRRPMSYRLTGRPEIHYIPYFGVYEKNGRQYISESNETVPLFEIEDFTTPGNKKVMILLDTRGNRYRCESVSNPMVVYLYNSTNYDTLSIHYTHYEANLDGTIYGAKTLDYTVAALPRQLDVAYCVLIDPYSANSRYTNLLCCDVTSPEGETVQYTFYPNHGFNRGYINDSDFSGVPTSPSTPDVPGLPSEPNQSIRNYIEKLNTASSVEVLAYGEGLNSSQKTFGNLYKEKDGLFSGFVAFYNDFSINVGTADNPEYLSVNKILKFNEKDIMLDIAPAGNIGNVCPVEWDSRIYWVELNYDSDSITMSIKYIRSISLWGDFNNWNPFDKESVVYNDQELRDLQTMRLTKYVRWTIMAGQELKVSFLRPDGYYINIGAIYSEETGWRLASTGINITLPQNLKERWTLGIRLSYPSIVIYNNN